MKADRLLDFYDRVADAPDAVGRLRRFVLDLAVRGNLVAQDPTDEPASELLKRFAAEKARMARAGEIRRSRNLSNGDPVRRFGVPASWEWSAIESVAHIEMGQSPRSEHYNRVGHGLAFFQGKADFGHRHPTPRYWCTKPTKIAEPGDILLSIRAPVGPTNVADQRCCIGRGLAALRPLEGLNREFMLLALKAFELDLASLGFGTTFTAITKKQLTKYGCPLPPLAEQYRIVAKVDELMVLCDRLEETRAAREDTRDRLTKASLARLTAPDTPESTFRGHARFAIHALPALTARADQVKHLRQTILGLAVRGKLVEQDPADEPASALLELVRSQRPQASTRTRGKRRLLHALNTGPVDAELFALPNGWEWTPLAGVSDVTMGQSPPGETYNRSGDGVPLINGPVEFTTGPFGRTIINQFTTSPKKFCEEGDLLLCVRGSTTGRTNVAGFRACIGRGVAAISSSFDDEFIRIFLWKAREDILAMGRGMAFPSVNKKQLESLPVPFPPLAEQHRIVAKVGELMVLCDRLEDGLGSVAGTRSHLLESLLQGTLTRSAYKAATAEAVEA